MRVRQRHYVDAARYRAFEFCLAVRVRSSQESADGPALEVVATNESFFLLGQLNQAGHEARDVSTCAVGEHARVLRSCRRQRNSKCVRLTAVDERRVLQDRGDREQRRRRDLVVAVGDGLEQVLGRVVPGAELGVALGVGGPEDDDLVEAVLGLEIADVLADMLEMGLLVVAGDQVVGPILLIGRDEVRVVLSGC